MINFWQRLKKPFTVLAPMDDVTDVVFREMLVDLAPPDVFFTEFVNADGIVKDKSGRVKSKLKFLPSQRPIVAQIWGINLDFLKIAANVVAEMGFNGIDINMGCPVKNVVHHGCGAAMIKAPELAREVILAVKSGARNIPVSVKTRLGFNQIITTDWISFLLNQDLAALTVHGRIAKQMSTGMANWEEIGKVVQMRDKINPHTLIIGNGDVVSYDQALEMHKTYGVDGVMIGRGIFKDPYVFLPQKIDLTINDRINLAIKHVNLFITYDNNEKKYNMLKKFFKIYISSFDGAAELRAKLMETKTSTQALEVLADASV